MNKTAGMRQRAGSAGVLALACALLSACAAQLPAPTLTFENVQRLGQVSLPPIALGEFTRGPSLPESRDRSIAVRADTLRPPTGGTFSTYLRDTVAAELAGGGKLDPSSAYVLSAQLTRSEVSTGGAQSQGALGARFQLMHNGQMLYDDVVAVEESWPSAFFGPQAIPDAMNHYTGLYPKLFGALLADPDFRAAFH